MKAKEIQIGGHYSAKVSGNLTTVRVDAIRETSSYRAHQPYTPVTRYDVTNLATGRKITFRSAAKFRCVVKTQVLPMTLQVVPCQTAYRAEQEQIARCPKCGRPGVVCDTDHEMVQYGCESCHHTFDLLSIPTS